MLFRFWHHGFVGLHSLVLVFVFLLYSVWLLFTGSEAFIKIFSVLIVEKKNSLNVKMALKFANNTSNSLIHSLIFPHSSHLPSFTASFSPNIITNTKLSNRKIIKSLYSSLMAVLVRSTIPNSLTHSLTCQSYSGRNHKRLIPNTNI